MPPIFFYTKMAYFLSPKISQNILLNNFVLLKRWYHLWCFVTQDLSSKFVYMYTCILHHTITNLYYVHSGTCHRYGFLFFGNRFDGEAFICFYKWHFILYFAHRKHIQKPVEKLKIVTEISQEFYSKDVSKYAINKQYKLVNLNLYN